MEWDSSLKRRGLDRTRKDTGHPPVAAPSVAMVAGAWCCAEKGSESQSAGGPGRVVLRDDTVGMAEGR